MEEADAQTYHDAKATDQKSNPYTYTYSEMPYMSWSTFVSGY